MRCFASLISNRRRSPPFLFPAVAPVRDVFIWCRLRRRVRSNRCSERFPWDQDHQIYRGRQIVPVEEKRTDANIIFRRVRKGSVERTRRSLRLPSEPADRYELVYSSGFCLRLVFFPAKGFEWLSAAGRFDLCGCTITRIAFRVCSAVFGRFPPEYWHRRGKRADGTRSLRGFRSKRRRPF